MFQVQTINTNSKADIYAHLVRQAQALLEGESDLIANAANFAALVFHALEDVNWAGFYFFDGTELVVGPFQGQPACIRIPRSKGVCGTALETRKTHKVEDVTTHANHIFCDGASRSEIVVPLIKPDQTPLGVWDVDSPITHRFDNDDKEGMEALCQVFMQACFHQDQARPVQ